MKYDIGIPDTLKVESFGFPGERTFRIFLDNSGKNISLWIEKQQLFELAMAIKRILDIVNIDPKDTNDLEPLSEAKDMPLMNFEFTVGRLSLAHKPNSNLFVVEAYNITDNSSEEPLLAFYSFGSQLDDLSEKAFKICAAGRPMCSLCGEPMDLELHMCSEPDGILQI
jgi:uncharacterized repeat protein (TIGR03847 family)